MIRERKDIRPVLIKFGLAFALSFAGFFYSRLKNRRTRFLKPPPSIRLADQVDEVDNDIGRAEMKKVPSPRCVALVCGETHQEDVSMPKGAIDNPAVVYSPGGRQNEFKDGYLLPEFNDLLGEYDINANSTGVSPRKDVDSPRSDADTPRTVRSLEKNDSEQEIRHLKSMVRMLREREKNLEFQLLEFYGLKEQETAMMELQNRLKISNMEIKLFTLKIESLQADNQRLQAQVADHAKVVAELDAARAKMKLLRKRLKAEAEQNKEHILSLQKRVSWLQEEELKATANDSEVKMKLQRLKELEAEAEDLRKSNHRLTLENSELARQLESTKILANSVLEDPETDALRELNNKLKQENEDLEKKVERLQADRCNDCEELVYLRWINACLRYELRNFQPAHGRTVARDLSKSLSPRSEEKAKQLILEYARTEEVGKKGINIIDFESDQWSSSHASYVVDSGDLDDSLDSPKSSHSSKMKFFNKLRRLIRGKDTHHNHYSSAERTLGTEESDSPGGSSSVSTATDATSDQQFSRIHSLSLDLSRQCSGSSTDIHGVKNPRREELKDIEIGRRNSDIGPTGSYGHKRFMSGRYTASYLSPENQLEQCSSSAERTELLKFAEVLKDSGHNRTRAFHKKSASLGEFGNFHRTSSQ